MELFQTVDKEPRPAVLSGHFAIDCKAKPLKTKLSSEVELIVTRIARGV
jgi:hypothetical protein